MLPWGQPPIDAPGFGMYAQEEEEEEQEDVDAVQDAVNAINPHRHGAEALSEVEEEEEEEEEENIAATGRSWSAWPASKSKGGAHHDVSDDNIMLKTDGYKFSHHKQMPVSWLPKKWVSTMWKLADRERAGTEEEELVMPPPPIVVFDTVASGDQLYAIGAPTIIHAVHWHKFEDDAEQTPTQAVIVTNVSSVVVDVEAASDDPRMHKKRKDHEGDGNSSTSFLTWKSMKNNYKKPLVCKAMPTLKNSNFKAYVDPSANKLTNDDVWFPQKVQMNVDGKVVIFKNVDTYKQRHGSRLGVNMKREEADMENYKAQYMGAYSVSYFTPRAYGGPFEEIFGRGGGE